MKSFILVSLLIAGFVAAAAGQSCSGRCGVNDYVSDCQCNSLCSDFNDCCTDYDSLCMSCSDRCDDAYVDTSPCHCNSECSEHSNCCSDYSDVCDGTGNPTGDLGQLILDLTEELWELDNSVGQYLVVDADPSTPLFTSVDSAAFEGATFQAFMTLQDNYVANECADEDNTAAEQAEVSAFLDLALATPVMVRTEAFLTENGMLSTTLRGDLESLFFRLYSRCGSYLSSTAFEHSFMGELDGGVGGFHNWITFYQEEQAGNLEYTENINYFDFSEKMKGLEMGFTWNGEDKPISSMYIGSTPEFELSIYIVSFLSGTNAVREVSLNGFKHAIQTWDFHGDATLVGSAYPDLSYT